MPPAHEQLFFDPFADAGENAFNPEASFEALFERYENREVEHNYAADQFVRDVEAVLLDAQFVDRLAAMQSIASRLHALCGEDHGLQTSINQSQLKEYLPAFGGDDDHHSHTHHREQKGKKELRRAKKEIKLAPGWLQAFMDRYMNKSKTANTNHL